MTGTTVVWASITAAALVVLPIAAFGGDATPQELAGSILEATGVQGGLVVHVGCGDGKLTASLHKDSSYVVHGLDSDAKNIERARQHIRSLGLYGTVSAERWSAPILPYNDNTVNLLVVSADGAVSQDEVNRVLVPLGVAYTKQSDGWAKTIKPRRDGVDEWTHFLYDASGNPVSHDSVVGPPRHLQWTEGPRHARSHEYTPSVQAVVSSGGRIFYIVDQGSIATLRDPEEWKLLARDAYNGILLWEQPISKWFSHIFGWTQGPRQLQRKLVAVGNRIYVTLGFHAPLVQLDAATGATLRVYPGTEGTEEILWHQGVLLLVVREVTKERRAAYQKWRELVAQPTSPLHLRDTRVPIERVFRDTENQAARSIVAIDPESGSVLWSKSGADSVGLKPLSTRACGDRVFCEKRGGIHCFDLKTGESMWHVRSDPMRAVSKDAIVCVSKSKVTARSPEDGAPRWSKPVPLTQVRDVLLIGNSLWIGGGKPYDSGRSKYTGPSWGAYFAVELDMDSGNVVREITGENPKHHHRCYENKATDRYILGGRRGTEFLDLESGDYLWHSWARGTCRYGVMPCNGLLYTPPHACGCYITVKLMGFNALAPARNMEGESNSTSKPAERLERGPAYDTSKRAVPSKSDDWPTFRGDAQRSGRARCTVPVSLTTKWQANIGATITAPTAAGGRIFVARQDQHDLVAIDGDTGKQIWTYTTGGRIDSPPTIHRGQVLLGCNDGYVYSFRATDGALAWRYHAARDSRRIIANGQLEAVSPVHGSLLVDNGAVSFAAGRSSYLDGGLDLYRLNPMTGKKLSRTEIYSPDSETGRQPKQYGPASMPGARSDILAADGQHIYLRDLAFTKEGVEVTERQPHLFTLTDFLDDSEARRSYWIFGEKPSISTGCSGRSRNLLYGRILVFNETDVFGYGRESVHWSNEFEDGSYRVFARRRDAAKPRWSKYVPVRIRAMLLAGDIVFAAGAGSAPDKDPDKRTVSPTPLLLALSAVDGAELARYPIAAAPVFNGMAAAGGNLILALENGRLLCLQPNADRP